MLPILEAIVMWILSIALLVALASSVVKSIQRSFLKKEQEPPERWMAVAESQGLTYRPGTSDDLSEQFRFLNQLKRGYNQYATDILEGALGGRHFLAFSHHHQRRSDDKEGESPIWYGVMAVQTGSDRPLPEVSIGPESMLNRFSGVSGYGDINFESVEFSRLYKVRSSDRRLAYDICNTAMMEYLVSASGTTIEIEGHWLATITAGRLTTELVPGRLAHIRAITERLPAFRFGQR